MTRFEGVISVIYIGVVLRQIVSELDSKSCPQISNAIHDKFKSPRKTHFLISSNISITFFPFLIQKSTNFSKKTSDQGSSLRWIHDFHQFTHPKNINYPSNIINKHSKTYLSSHFLQAF